MDVWRDDTTNDADEGDDRPRVSAIAYTNAFLKGAVAIKGL